MARRLSLFQYAALRAEYDDVVQAFESKGYKIGQPSKDEVFTDSKIAPITDPEGIPCGYVLRNFKLFAENIFTGIQKPIEIRPFEAEYRNGKIPFDFLPKSRNIEIYSNRPHVVIEE